MAWTTDVLTKLVNLWPRARLLILAASYRVSLRRVSQAVARLACTTACLRVLACQTVASPCWRMAVVPLARI